MHGSLSSSSLSSSSHSARISSLNSNGNLNSINGTTRSKIPTIHAVDRSSELLACARTALQILQHDADAGNGQVSSSLPIKGSDLKLNQHFHDHRSTLGTLQKDALQVLKLSDVCLKTLSTLVRRRGHTNDPTMEMQQNVQQFQTYMKELHDISTSISTQGSVPFRDLDTTIVIRNRRGKQRKKHYDLVAAWLQNCGKDQTIQFQKAKEMRGEVLKAQVRRRKLLEGRQGQKVANPGNSNPVVPLKASTAKAVATGVAIANSRNISKNKSSQMNSPLFTMTTKAPISKPIPAGSSSMISKTSINTGNGHTNGSNGHYPNKSTSSAIPPMSSDSGRQPSSSAYGTYYGNNNYNGNYGNAYGGGYGGNGGYQDGMRRRTTSQPQHPQNIPNDQKDQQQSQQQQYSQRTKTRQRLEEARKAERSIAELTQVFGKMASLVSAQEEVLENIEYDVENSYMETDAASKEIGKLYDIKKGNRGLILKTFAILIFMIIFFRFF